MQKRTVDLTITSLVKQDITLIARYGIEDISATDGVLVKKPESGIANCDLNLPEGKPVEIHLQLGLRNPFDWIEQVI
jgi:hypothetical protein